MKRYFLLNALFLLLVIPTFVSASTCTSTRVSGSATGGNAGSNLGKCASGRTCLWSWIQDTVSSWNYGGVRVQIYKYTGGGAGNAKLVGQGVDIWAKDHNFSDSNYSSPSTPNLKNKANCSASGWGHFNLSYSKYLSGDYGNVETSDGLWTAFMNQRKNNSHGEVADFLLKHDNGIPRYGWIKEYFLQPLIDDDYDSLTSNNYSINKFHLSKADIDDIKSEPDSYYITAEILYRIYSNGYDGHTGIYYGTVSELDPFGRDFAHTVGAALYSKDVTVGKALIRKSTSGLLTYWDGSQRSDDGHRAYCNKTFGYAIWNLQQVCEECGHSCQKDCEQYNKGSFQHQLCAQGYCESNEKNDVKGCINKCTYIDKDEGCDGECKVSKKSPGNSDCDSSLGTEELETNSCHDDNASYTVVDKNLGVNYSSSGKYSYSSLKYYKIDCKENFKLRDLPKFNSNAWLTKADFGTLHLGFTLDYKKSCEIKYKVGISDGKGNVSYSWQSNFKKSRLENDIIDTKNAIDNSNKAIANLENELKTAKTEKKKELIQESIASYKNIIEVAKKTFDELMALAPTSFSYNGKNGGGVIDARLITLTQLDHKGEKYFEPTIDLEVPDISAEASISGSVNTTTDYLVLEPVTCVEVPQEKITRCVWREDEKKYYVKYEKNTLLECSNADSNGNTTPIKAKVAANKYSASLEKTLYYELPDSYVLTQSEDDGLVFHSTYKQGTDINIETAKQKCNDYLKGKDYTGKCLKEANLYQFPQFKDKLIVDELTTTNKEFKYKIKINNIGYCGDKVGGYTYSCSYQFKKDTECSKCSQYTKGTAAYEECYNKNCSCEAVCNGSVSCEQKYCPTTCVSCGETTYYEDEDCPTPPDGECDSSKNDCCNENCSKNNVAGSDSFYACQYECCNSKANGNVQAINDCCHKYCTNIARGSDEKYNECVDIWCPKCPECEGTEYVYRSINIRDPFNGRENQTDGVGLNWRGKIGFITEENNNKNKQYYDSTNSYDKDESTAEYVFDLSSNMLKGIKKTRKIGSESVDTTYQLTKSSKETNSKISSPVNDSDVVDPYCSYLLHDVFEANGSLKQNDAAGMGCK